MVKKTKTRGNTQKEQIISSDPCPLLYPFLAHTTTTHWRKLSTPSELLPTKNHTLRGKKNTINFKIPNNIFKFPSAFLSQGCFKTTQLRNPISLLVPHFMQKIFSPQQRHSHEILFPQTNKQTCFFNFLFPLFVVKVYAKTTHPIYTHTTTNTHVRHLNRNSK